MKRWLLWFGIGFALFWGCGLVLISKNPALEPWQLPAWLLFWAWVLLTLVAIPVSVIVWLARGRGPKPHTD